MSTEETTTAVATRPPEVPAATSADDPMTSSAGYAHAYTLARRFSESQLVPAHLRGKPQDCFIALLMAREMNESPIMVMQSIYFISGKAGWSASYMIARANRSGVFSRPIRWRTTGTGDALVVEAYAVDLHGEEIACTVSMAMAKAEGWTKNDKYRTMGDHMLRLRSATMLIRLYCPEVLLGMHTADEYEDVIAAKATTTRRPPPVQTVDVEADPISEALRSEPREPGEEG